MSSFKPNYFQRRNQNRGPKANERIRALDVQVIGSDGGNLGSMPLNKAIEIAKQNEFVQGIKVQISGRLNGAEIARSEWIKDGRMPLQTLRADILYVSKIAKTTYGILGVKVWIFKGEKLK